MNFDNLKDQVSNLTLYDLKAGVRKVQNAVMNYTEMEAKVREATNNEPWGASSTTMQEIANGTYSYQLLNEIMPMIYKRFTEKSAEEWRQIYKALQLLEFLVKNGSERVIDDARSHLSLLKMLRQFQFLDQNGKDQGINVRNRAKELGELLGDVDRIRSERKKARSNRNKFGGVEGGGGFSGGMSSGSRYGGFGSEDASFGGGSSGQVYGDGGGFGGNTSSFQDSSRRDKFEEYDEGDDPSHTSSSRPSAGTTARAKREEPKKPKEPEVDLFDFGDDIPPATPPKPASNGKQPVSSALDDDDDFGDFSSAAPENAAAPPTSAMPLAPPPQTTHSISSTTQFAQPTPVSNNQGNFSNIMSTMSPAPTGGTTSSFATPPLSQQSAFQAPAQTKQMPTGYQAATPNYFTTVQVQQKPASTGPTQPSKPALTSNASFGSKPAPKPSASGGDAFSNLWSTASTTAGVKKNTPTSGPNLASLAQQKTSQGIWGPNKSTSSTPVQSPPSQQPQTGGGLDDLLG